MSDEFQYNNMSSKQTIYLLEQKQSFNDLCVRIGISRFNEINLSRG